MKGSLFGGMKVKGPAQKPKAAQTQTHLGTSNFQVEQKVNKVTQKIKPTNEKPAEKTQQKSQLSNTQASKYKQQSSFNSSSQEKQQQASFEVPPLSKNKPQKSQTDSIKNPSKKSSDHNSNEDKKQKQGSMQEKSEDIDQLKASSEFRKNSERKQSASESNYAFDKKKNRDRNQSNPFFNQIKKNTSLAREYNQQQDHEHNSKSASATDFKMPRKSQKQALIQQINQSHTKIIEFILKQKQLKQTIIQIAGNLQQHRDQLTDSVQKQCQCVEKQEYDEADSYQNKIQNLQKKIQEQQSQLIKRQDEFYKNQYEQLKLEKNQHYESKTLVRKIKLVQLQLLEDANNLKRKRAENQQNENVKIDNQNKKITRLQNDIKFQFDQISEFEKKYKEDLNSRKDPLTSQLNQNQKKKTILEQQIEQLEKKLKQKKQHLKQINGKVTSIKKQIKEVQQVFKEEGIKIQDRKKKLGNLEQQKNSLISKVKQLQEKKIQQVQEINKKAEQFQKQASNLAQMASQMEESSGNFEDKLEERKVKVDTFIHNTKQLKDFEAKHKTKKQKVKELQFKKANVAAQANGLEQKRTQLKIRIPKLQSEQKSMAEAKNFKAAGMKKNQIKEAQQETESISKKIQQCFIKQKQLQEQISKLKEQQMDHINQENQIRKNLAISQFRFNVTKWQQLKNQQEWLSKLSQKSQIRSKYLVMIQEEIKNLIAEIQYIGEQYSLDLKFLTQNKKEKKKEKTQKPKENQQKTIKSDKKIQKDEKKQQATPKTVIDPKIQQQQTISKQITQMQPKNPIKQTQNQTPDVQQEEQTEKTKEQHNQHKQTDEKVQQEQKSQEQQQEQVIQQQTKQEQHAHISHGQGVERGLQEHEDVDDEGGYVPLQLDD